MKANLPVRVTEYNLRHVLGHLRERDAEEIFALRWDDDRESYLRDLLPWCGDMVWCWERQRIPVAIVGMLPVRPGVWVAFAFGTVDWPLVVNDVTRQLKRYTVPAMLRAGCRRVECRALETHNDSRIWIASFGGVLEAILQDYGKNGETFIQYVWRPHSHGR